MTVPAWGHDPIGDTPSLTFKRLGGQYRLVDIWDMGDQGSEISGS